MRILTKFVILCFVFSIFLVWQPDVVFGVGEGSCGQCVVQYLGDFYNPETGQIEPYYLDGCHCLQTSCKLGQYEAPNGQCYDVGSGGTCACGADSSGSCLSCGGGGSECWDGAVNCPAGTVKTSAVSQTFCRNTG